MGITDITLYNIIRKRLGEQETYELVEFIHSEVKAEMDTKTNVFLTKGDKVDLIDRMNNTSAEANLAKSELIDRINKVSEEAKETKSALIDRINKVSEEAKEIKSELTDRINKVSEEAKEIKSELTDRINGVIVEVAKVKSDLIFWMVGLTVLQYLLLTVTKKFF
jgi:seryl-tRNA synthetase